MSYVQLTPEERYVIYHLKLFTLKSSRDCPSARSSSQHPLA
jgi:hypothetical protein